MLSVGGRGDTFLSLPSPHGKPTSVPTLEWNTRLAQKGRLPLEDKARPHHATAFSPFLPAILLSSMRNASFKVSILSCSTSQWKSLLLSNSLHLCSTYDRVFQWGCVGNLGCAYATNSSTCLYSNYSSVWYLLKFIYFHTALLLSCSHSLCLGKGHPQLPFLHITISHGTYIRSFCQTVVIS